MPVEEIAEGLFQLVEQGQPVDSAKVIPFKADNGATITNGVKQVIQGTNGTALETVAATTGTGAGTTTAGAGLLALDVGVAGAAIAPILGIALGFGLYNLAPEFWNNLSNTLVNAGKTIGGKVIGFFGANGETGFDKETIEIFANAFADAGLFSSEYQIPEYSDTPQQYTVTSASMTAVDCWNYLIDRIKDEYANVTFHPNYPTIYQDFLTWAADKIDYNFILSYHKELTGTYAISNFFRIHASAQIGQTVYIGSSVNTPFFSVSGSLTDSTDVVLGQNSTIFPRSSVILFIGEKFSSTFKEQQISTFNVTSNAPYLQPGAVPPSGQGIDVDYPNYQPWYVPNPQDPVYPVPVPGHGIEQAPGQDGEQVEIPDLVPFITPNLPIPEPSPEPIPEPSPEPGPTPEPDPDPSPTPDPEDEPQPEPSPEVPDDPVTPEPPEPTPEPTTDPTPIPPIIVVPGLPTVSSSALFTVYNPTMAQLSQLGGFLWSTSILDQIIKIWQNPMDGIISLQKVYANPSVSGSSNIILGNLDSGVSASIISSQFTSVNCGKVTVKERFKNSTDYSPYTTCHIYLPFIGIVELDIDEVMDSDVYCTYSVDVYTGTCLCELTVVRNRDIPNGANLYQFSGNCSQSIPLTGSTAQGLMSSLLSIASVAISVPAGGGAAAAASTISQLGHSLNHEMIHVGRSGSLSANAGILGHRKPYIILGRRNSADANGYNNYWGYPANKTVYLANCQGFTKIKAINLQTLATQQEKDEIESLLKSGVIF